MINRYEVVGVRRGRQPDPADGAGRAEADGVQGAGHLLLRRREVARRLRLQGPPQARPQRRLRHHRRERRADRLLPQVPDFGASLLRSTFHIEGPGYAGTGRERNQVVGLLRRFTELDFIPIHFDFVDAEGNALFSVERKMSIGDRYRVTVPDERVDFRVAAAVAVGLDALRCRADACRDVPRGPRGRRGRRRPRPQRARASTSPPTARRSASPTCASRARTSRRSRTSTRTACGAGSTRPPTRCPGWSCTPTAAASSSTTSTSTTASAGGSPTGSGARC